MNSKLVYVVLFCALSASALWGCGDAGKSHAEVAEDRHATHEAIVRLTRSGMSDIGLTVYTVTRKPLTGGLTIPATIVPNQDLEARIGSLVPGRVHQVFVKAGDMVSAGQVMMTVEGLDVGAIKAGFLKARAAFEYTKTAYERQKKLFDENVGSQKAMLESKAEYDKARAEYTAEDRRIHSVGFTDEDVLNGKKADEHVAGTLPIKSQISGVVVERNVVVGQFVDPMTNAFRVINTRSVWIDGQIYEKDMAKINRTSAATFTTSTYPHEVFHGRVLNIGQTVDEHSRTITVRGEFDNPQGKLKSNMFGDLTISLGIQSEALMVPEESVVRENGGAYVFVQTTDTTFIKRTIVAGTAVGTMIEIREGVKEGERVASAGVFSLKSELKKEEIAGDEH
ncbi:MAG TPA: efflux RND transporter periplasmic adaptor subunit [Bacteroidota bacterium]|nr:efflux RND transporter periplasmic adaptor subunit [Bacteroidota bacterium]